MKKVCFITHSPPDQLGGLSLFHKNLLNYLKTKDLDITWAYFGDRDAKYKKDNITYIEIKKSIFQIKVVENNYKIKKFLKKNCFDVVFSTGGPWTYLYLKPTHQKLIHIYHGTVYYFTQNHIKRFGFFKKMLFIPILSLCKLSEIPSWDCDKIICVSNKVKKQVGELYGETEVKVIRTGVDLNEFKPRKSKGGKLYGLYVGGGGYYTKGLDRTIKLSKEIYKLNPNYKLIVIGPDKTKVGDLLNKKFVIFLDNVPRNEMKYYYNASKIFFCTSRYEGGGPTLVTSEAMASGCMVVASKDSQQEIIRNNYNGLIISKFDEKDAKRILKNIHNKKLTKNSLKTIQKLSLESWGDKFLEIIK